MPNLNFGKRTQANNVNNIIAHSFSRIMVISSFVALNMVEDEAMRDMKLFISQTLDRSTKRTDIVKPACLHLCLKNKLFVDTNQPFIQCPIHFQLRDRTSIDQLIFWPIWMESSQRSQVNKKAKVGVKKHSVICLDDFSVVRNEQSETGYIFFLKKYAVIKKNVDEEAYRRWISA